ncbi:acetyl-CoA synthetase-like protein [Parathielavia appendiculata]|uniref:Acetyl-CoA synthetase-like protein n=1 Tax=Parathielavia appendiculata TaxID=2587402 RepID=A0AAN6U1R4_9PEZI|nr:acetyl-CoA synthetase-like protein [Parathielavia appendiculata]
MVSSAVAYAGSPAGHMPVKSTFDFTFSQPFQTACDFVPPEHALPRIEPERPIFVDNKTDRTLTFGQISKDALALASGLLSLGLDPNNTIKLPPTPSCPPGPEIAPVVLIQLPNCLPFAPVFFGTLASGMTATLVSPALTSDEIAWILQNARPRVIITATACLPAMKSALAKQPDTSYFSSIPVFTVDTAADTYPSAQASPPPAPSDWRSLLSASPSHKLTHAATTTSSPIFPPSTAPSRTAVILWSSGTSGRSKGVLLSHHALNFSIASLWHDADYFGVKPQRQAWLGYVPFYHVFGLCNVFLLAVATGSTVYTMPSFHLETVLKAIRDRRVTYMHMAPPVAVMLAKAAVVEPYARGGGFASVVAGVTGGAPLGHEVVEEVYKRCGFRVRLGYGLSETCSTALQRGCGENEMREQAGDTGRPHWGVEVMIADGEVYARKEGEKTTAAGVDVEGEVLVRAAGLLSAYLPVELYSGEKKMDMSVTEEALTADGWFRTGDVGALNSDGRLRITDRLKELIKVRAYQVAPAELEAVLCSSEAVADAGVIGIYDKSEATEWPRAFVVPRAGKNNMSGADLEKLAGQLKVLVEGRTAKYKWLMGGIVFVDQIPKSPSGKILRRVLKNGGEETKGVEVKLYEKKRRDAKL